MSDITMKGRAYGCSWEIVTRRTPVGIRYTLFVNDRDQGGYESQEEALCMRDAFLSVFVPVEGGAA